MIRSHVIGLLCVSSLISLHAGTNAPAPSAKNPGTAAAGCGHNPGPWDTSIYSGLALTHGTVDSLTVNAGIRAVGSWTDKEAILFADYLYGETQSATTNNAFRAGMQWNFLVSDRVFVGLGSGFLFDEVADVDYRVNLAPSIGYYLIKTDATKLTLEVGPGYTWEKQGGVSRDFFGYRAAERFEHVFANGARIYQTLEYMPESNDFSSYLLAAEAGLEVPLTSKLKWRLAARDVYDSTPSAGRDENDLTFLTGLSYAIGDSPAIKCKVCRAEAAAKPAPAPAKDTWLTTGSLGFSLTRGNSETLLLTAGIDTVKYTDNDEVRFGVGGSYGEVGSSTNVENLRANAQYNHVIGGPLYLGAGLDYLMDDIADLDYRITPAMLLGAYLVKTDATKLALEAGPAWTFQKQGGIEDNFFSVVARERFETVLSSGSKIFQSVSALFNTEDSSDYVITAEAGIDMKIAGAWNLRIAAQDIYDAIPASGAEQNEFRLISGISINF